MTMTTVTTRIDRPSKNRPIGDAVGEFSVPRPAKSALYRKSAAAFRWLHIYLSMLSFAALMFFAFTGITLNHPTWFGANEQQVRDIEGSLPAGLISDEKVDELAIAEHLRATHRLQGRVTEFESGDLDCMVVFKAPGYSADVFLDRQSGAYTVTESMSGVVAVMNDLHKGRDSGKSWALVIDVSAILMILMSLSGFGLLFYLKKRRASGILASVAGTVALLLAWALLVP
jgi:hypothetical protein